MTQTTQSDKKVSIHVTDIDGKVHTFFLDQDEEKSIIDLAEENNVELPRSCRSGACFSCCATVSKGQEHLDPNKTGEMLIDVDEDEVLTCICGVKSGVFESGESVEIDLTMVN